HPGDAVRTRGAEDAGLPDGVGRGPAPDAAGAARLIDAPAAVTPRPAPSFRSRTRASRAIGRPDPLAPRLRVDARPPRAGADPVSCAGSGSMIADGGPAAAERASRHTGATAIGLCSGSTEQEQRMSTTPRIAFLASQIDDAQQALAALTTRHGQCQPEEADVLCALGGDGFMLQTLHRYGSLAKPVFGMKLG